MIIKNFFEAPSELKPCHDGQGLVKHVSLFQHEHFDTNLRFILTIDLPPGGSVGYHTHGEDEEVYVILEGRGIMTVNDEKRDVRAGDVILNKPGWSHGVENTGEDDLKIFVFEVGTL